MGLTGKTVWVFLTILGMLACSGPNESGDGEAGGIAQMPPPPEVSVAPPLTAQVQDWEEVIGRFAPVDRVEVKARVSGYIEEVRFRDGDLVEQGDVLYVIDQRPFEIALTTAKADLDQASARLKLAQNEYDRVKDLRESGAISAEELDRRVQDLAVSRSAMAGLEARVKSAELDLSYTEVIAPINGRISEDFTAVGNLITSGDQGGQVLTTIVTLDPINFYMEVSEAQLLRFLRLGEGQTGAEGTLVRVRLLDEDGYPHEGVIDFIDNEVNTATGTMRVRGLFDNSNFLLQPGMFGRARVPAGASYDAMLVPESAISTNQTYKLVTLVGENNMPMPRPVELGALQDNGLRVIRSGLSPGEKLIVKGLARVFPGMPVQPIETTIEAVLAEPPPAY